MGKAAKKVQKRKQRAAEKAEEEAAAEKADDWDAGTKKLSKKQLLQKEKQEERSRRGQQKKLQMEIEEVENANSKKKGQSNKRRGGRKQNSRNKNHSDLDDALDQVGGNKNEKVPTISAEGLDNAIAALSLLKKDAVNNNELDRHPEKRYKHALAEYSRRRLPELKKENPGMRRHQLEEMVFKEFKKSKENPFNQETNLAYNATDEDVKQKKQSIKSKRERIYEH